MAGINDLFKKYYDQLDPVRQTLSGMASNAQNALRNPVKAISELPEQVRAGRQLVQQHVSPVLAQQAQNVVNRIPAPVIQQMMPIVPPEMSRKVLGMGAAGLADQPESYLRGAEFLLNSKRRQEVSNMDLMGKLQAGGDVMNFVPVGSLTKGATKLAGGVDAAQAMLGQAGKIKLGPGKNINLLDDIKEMRGLKKVSKVPETLEGLGKRTDQIAPVLPTGAGKNMPDSYYTEKITGGLSGKPPPTPPPTQVKLKPPPSSNSIDGDKNAFQDWVNSRRAVSPEQAIVKKQFADLDGEGVNAFFNIQKGDPKYSKVREFLDSKFEEVKKIGMDLGYESDYLPQVWANTEDEIAKVFGKRIVTKPGFTLNKVIDDYKMGIDAGLTPKYEKVSDLLAWYQGKVTKSVADRNFFNYLHKNQHILPYDQAPKDWVTVNPDRFPKIKYTDTNGVEATDNGPFKAPKELAESINNYLFNPGEDGNMFQRSLSGVANYVSKVKNIALSFGVPGTAINAHGINILTRHTLMGTGGNPISRLLTGARYLVDPFAAKNFLQKELKDAPRAVRAGLTLSTEDYKAFTDIIESQSRLGKAWGAVFETRLFDQMIPALKLSSFKNLEADFAKTLGFEKGSKEAAKLVNNVYGGINWEQMGRNRDFQNLLRIAILAPDWAETTIKLGGNMAKSAVTGGPVAGRYRTMIAAVAGAYVSANVANKLSSGHYMWENDPGHTFEIEAGYTNDGQKRYIRPFGTALDMYRLPYDIALSLKKGDLNSIARVFRNRLSIPAGVVVGAFYDTDYRGQPIGYKGKDKYGNEMPIGTRVTNIAGEAAQLVGFPSFLQQTIKTASGQQGIEQGLTQGFELPFRYSGGAYSKSQKTAEGVAKSGGMSGKDLYDLNEKTRGVTLSENQKELLREGGIGVLDDILDLKSARQVKNQIKDITEQMATGELSEEEGTAQIDQILNSELLQKQSGGESIKSASASTKIGNMTVSTREQEDFPFPDYEASAPGQVLRADLNFEGKGDADIVFHFKSPDGKIESVPQSKETYTGEKSAYGLELQIPEGTKAGVGEVWATVNGKEIQGTRRKHEVLNTDPVNRYQTWDDSGKETQSPLDRSHPTFRRSSNSLKKSDLVNGGAGSFDVNPSSIQEAKATMTPQDKMKEDILRMRVEATGTPQKANGKYYYRDEETGGVISVHLDRPLKEPKYTGNELLDKELRSDYKSAISTKVNDIVKLNELGVITESEAIKKISELKKLTATDLNSPIPEPKYTGNELLDKEMKSDYKSAISTRINEVVKAYEEGSLSAQEANKMISDLKGLNAKQGTGKKPKKITFPKIKGVTLKIPKSKFKDTSSNIKMVKRLGEQSYKIKRIKLKKRKLDLKTRK